jgi:hypothetical protein
MAQIAISRRLTGGLLALGSVVFFAAFGFLPTSSSGQSQFSVSRKDELLLIAANADKVRTEMSLYIAGSLVALVGLIWLTQLLRDAGDRRYASVGLALTVLATVLIVILAATQRTIELGFAQLTASTGAVPDLDAAFRARDQVLLNLYDVAGDLALLAFGLALLATKALPSWLGWGCVVIGVLALGAVTFASDFGGDAPGIPYVMLLITGITLLVARGASSKA